MKKDLVCSHAEAPSGVDLPAALAGLDELTFSHYDGVVQATPAFMRWYTTRPGMKAHVCQAAFVGSTLVSNVFVTLVPMVLGETVVTCGIIDTVMTHPEHRQRGLATALLARALSAIASEGADVSLLYTARGTPLRPPERFYRGLGYEPRELVTRFVRPAQGGGVAAATRLDAGDAQTLGIFAEALGSRDGWLVLDEELWRWRRLERPAQYPVVLCQAGSGAAAVCMGELLVSGAPQPLTVISDLVLPEGDDAGDVLRELLAAAPPSAASTLLCPQSDERLAGLLSEAGFSPAGVEVAMLRPITERGRMACERPARGWYVAVESLIGV